MATCPMRGSLLFDELESPHGATGRRRLLSTLLDAPFQWMLR
jgi:hypothetical protein